MFSLQLSVNIVRMVEVKNILVLFSLIYIVSGFPQDIIKCKINDEACLIKRANELIKSNEMSEKVGLNQIDPLLIKKMDIEQGGNASVAINLKFRNVFLIGFAKAEVYKVTGFKEDPEKNKLEIKFKAPLGTIQGPYQISGKILVLPIQGKGNVTLNLENLDISLKFLTTKVERDGKIYMHIDRTKFSYDVTGANVNFTNLFNGDKALGDNMNAFLNLNWRILLDELKKPIATSFADVFKNLLNDMFDKTPYNEFFEK